jgi:IS5 family transposase
VIPEIEKQIGANLTRIVAHRGYRGHNAPTDHKFKVYISGQRRRVTETIKRELRRRSAVEPVIGHSKAEHRMGRNFLAGNHGDAATSIADSGVNARGRRAMFPMRGVKGVPGAGEHQDIAENVKRR